MSNLDKLIQWMEKRGLNGFILEKAKQLQKEEHKTYTQEEMDNAKSEEWWKGWHAYGESL